MRTKLWIKQSEKNVDLIMVSQQPLTCRMAPLQIALLLVVGLWVATLYKLHARDIILYIMPSSALLNAQDRPRIMISTKKSQLYFKQTNISLATKLTLMLLIDSSAL